MHAEAGLLSLEAQSLEEAEFHLRASTTSLVWSRESAATPASGTGRARRSAGQDELSKGRPRPN